MIVCGKLQKQKRTNRYTIKTLKYVLKGTTLTILFFNLPMIKRKTQRDDFCIHFQFIILLCFAASELWFLFWVLPIPFLVFPLIVHKRIKIVRGYQSFNYDQGVPLQTTYVGITFLFRALCCGCNNATVLRGCSCKPHHCGLLTSVLYLGGKKKPTSPQKGWACFLFNQSYFMYLVQNKVASAQLYNVRSRLQ